MNNINSFVSKEKIPLNKKLKYLITIPCVNREERNAINVIDKTFEEFEKSNLFTSDINISIALFESGSKNTEYLNFIQTYIDKYCKTNPEIKIQIINSNIPLNGVTNTHKMFVYLNMLPKNLYDFVIWMDDDIFVCNNFIKNADTWIKNYANFSLFSSLYVPYDSIIINDKKHVHIANLPGFYGTCCTIFKPELAAFVIPHWFDKHFEHFEYNPDARFRDCVKMFFPRVRKILVSFPSLVDHMNIGSAIYKNKNINKGHKAKFYIGSSVDPKLYEEIL